MAVVTKQELEDAQVDCQKLEDVVNGSATINGTGIVTTRLGASVKTLLKLEAEIEAEIDDLSNQTDSAIAQIEGYLAMAEENAYILTESSANKARTLLQGNTGVAINFLSNSMVIAGGDAPQEGIPDDILTHVRASVCDKITNEGVLTEGLSGEFIIDRTPETAEIKGFLFGLDADNKLVNANDFSNASWTKTNVTPTSASAISPDGTNNAFKIEDTSAGAIGELRQNMNSLAGLATDSYVTFSVFAKAGTSSVVQFKPYFSGGTTYTGNMTVDLTTGEKTIADVNGVGRVTPYKNGWYLLEFVLHNNSTGNDDCAWRFYPDFAASANTGYVYLYKPTVHIGDVYRGTVDGRVADVVDMPLSEIDWNGLQGTVYLNYNPIPGTNELVTLLQIDDDTESQGFYLHCDDSANSNKIILVVKGELSNVTLASDATGRGGAKIAFTYNSDGDINLIINGEVQDTATGASLPTGLTTLRLGCNSAGAKQPNTSFKKFYYVPKEQTAEEIASAESSVGGASGVSIEDKERMMDAEVKNYAQNLMMRKRSGLQRLYDYYNLIIGLGQSLEFSASVTLPPLTLDASSGADTDSLMMGNSVRPSGIGADFEPIGIDQFNPLIATGDNNGIILTDYTTPWSTSYTGECPVVAESHVLKNLWNEFLHSLNDADRKIVAAICAKGETALADISNPSGDTYLRTVDCANVFKGLADGLSKTSGLLALSFAHGEADSGLGTSVATYKSGLRTYFDNIFSDICDDILGQTKKPLVVAQAPSKRWLNDNMYITQAMTEFEEENDDFVVALASYACQSDADVNNQHLTANGARYSGLKRAQALASVLIYNQNFFIPRIYKAWQIDNVIYVGYVAMHYPMQFKPIWDKESFDRSLLSNYGFRITDSSVAQTITDIEVLEDYDSIIKITLSTIPIAPIVYYAPKTTFDGRGNVCDSDPTKSPLNYIYDANQDSDADIVGITDLPYEMANFAMPQKITAIAY